MKKSIAVLGMGRFGQFLTAELSRNGADVLIADDNEENIRKFANEVSCAIKADLNDPEVIRGLGLAGVDTVVVAMGSSLDASIMCVMVAKELGVHRVIAKAASLRMGEILRRVGADEIIYPEKESAELTARRLMSSDFLDFFNLGSELCVFSMKPKKDAPAPRWIRISRSPRPRRSSPSQSRTIWTASCTERNTAIKGAKPDGFAPLS